MTNLMDGGFGNAMEHPQFGYASSMQEYADLKDSSVLKQPEDPMWIYTYDGPAVNSDLYGVNGFGVVFDDYYNGIFAVDETIDNDEPSDFSGTYDLTDEEELL